MKNLIKAFLEKRASRKARINAKLNSVLNDYKNLLNEYRLVQEGKSKLSRSERDFVKSRVQYLIRKGHIIINN